LAQRYTTYVHIPSKSQRVVVFSGLVVSVILFFWAFVRMVTSEPTAPVPPTEILTLADGIELAYIRAGSGQSMVAIHGSPGSRYDFAGLIPELSGEYDIIAIDMPGFGESSKWVSDYGYDAAADRIAEAVTLLELEDIVIAGFSWGGGVAISFAARYPDLTSRLLLIAAVGVEDGFHTGRYWSEYVRSLAAAPVLFLYPGPLAGGAITFAERFGFWRGFVDSDSRSIERLLPQISVPAVIVHGTTDTVVGPAAARRHYELLPDSTLHFYDGGHGWIYREYEPLADAIREAVSASAQ
jgi:pimeloyl-ACP methyl ester carboxylesterase